MVTAQLYSLEIAALRSPIENSPSKTPNDKVSMENATSISSRVKPLLARGKERYLVNDRYTTSQPINIHDIFVFFVCDRDAPAC